MQYFCVNSDHCAAQSSNFASHTVDQGYVITCESLLCISTDKYF